MLKVYDEETQRFIVAKFNILEEIVMSSYIEQGYNGRGIKMGLIDSGINKRHPIVKKMMNIAGEKDFTGEGVKDNLGHGTLSALCATYNGKIKFDLYIAKVLDEDGECTEDNVVQALLWLEQCGVGIINLSLGFKREKDCQGMCKVCNTINKIVLRNNGVIIISSAGNEKNGIFCPAINKNVISVGALNCKGDKVWENSAKGDYYIPMPQFFYAKLK